MAGIAARVDESITEVVVGLRFDAATDVFSVASSTWRWSLLVALAVGLALHASRVPAAPLWAGAAALLTSVVTGLLKDAFDRPRPSLSDPDITALVALPDSAAMPSGHASTAFAAAAVVSVFHPRLAVPALVTAAIISLSRVYLGVHWTGDVVAGAVLGIAIGLAVAWAARWVLGRPRTPAAQHT